MERISEMKISENKISCENLQDIIKIFNKDVIYNKLHLKLV